MAARKKQTKLEPKTMDVLRKNGYMVASTSWWQSFGFETKKDPKTGEEKKTNLGVRRDLFRIVDHVAIRWNKKGCLFVQTTDMSDKSKRVRKAIKEVYEWPKNMQLPPHSVLEWILKSENEFQIYAWGKNPLSNRWFLRVYEAKFDDAEQIRFVEIEHPTPEDGLF